MTDDGLIDGSAPSDASGDHAVLYEADTPTYDDTALVYGDGVVDYSAIDYSAIDSSAVDDTAIDYGGTPYTEMTTADPSSAIAFGDTSGLESGSTERAGCTAGLCPHPVAHPAETDWEQLVSAVPVEGQLGRFKPRCEGMSYPTDDDFRAAISAVRPLEPDAFSLQRLRTGWNEEVAAVIADWPRLLKTKLTALSAEWAGADFDAFTDQIDQTRALVQGILDDIDDAESELENREAAIYTLQGGDSGEIPYPAPLVGADGEWTNLVAVHVRPAWWHGDCITMTCEEAERALELGGADPKLATDVRAFIEQRTGGPLTAESAVSEVRVLAGEEARTSFEARITAELAGYAERQAAIDEAIGEKRAGQSEELASMATAGEDLPYPASADTAYMDTAAPVMEQPAAPVAPQATQDPTPVPPGGDGSVKTATAAEPEPEADAWETAPEDGEVSGGLAGGGGFGLGGGGGGIGGAASVATPAAIGTATGGAYGFGGATGGRFAAPTAPGAVPSGGAGPGGGAGGPRTAVVGGSRQQEADDRKRRTESNEDEDPEEEDLAFRETENVWGYVRPGDDPYI
ncbi:hypothetical protein [Glycomyces arizonensis]|uniref:hypothetical protein n=1 Tax=Glycomyces arizonensis TaxID=256035 RepID=UPI00040F8B08|nr:hypothetical protein [Glycomyces arizonensis]